MQINSLTYLLTSENNEYYSIRYEMAKYSIQNEKKHHSHNTKLDELQLVSRATFTGIRQQIQRSRSSRIESHKFTELKRRQIESVEVCLIT